MIWEFPKIRGALFRGPYNTDPTILGTILGSPVIRKLPFGREKLPYSDARLHDHGTSTMLANGLKAYTTLSPIPTITTLLNPKLYTL